MLNAETLERAPTPLFREHVRCTALSREYGSNTNVIECFSLDVPCFGTVFHPLYVAHVAVLFEYIPRPAPLSVSVAQRTASFIMNLMNTCMAVRFHLYMYYCHTKVKGILVLSMLYLLQTKLSAAAMYGTADT